MVDTIITRNGEWLQIAGNTPRRDIFTFTLAGLPEKALECAVAVDDHQTIDVSSRLGIIAAPARDPRILSLIEMQVRNIFAETKRAAFERSKVVHQT